MKLEVFKIFSTVYEEKSISQASKLLHLSQPAISKQIKLLEDHYNCLFFERTPHGIVSTPFGDIFYEYANKLLTITEKLEESLEESKRSDFPPLKVGASNTVGNYPLPCNVWLFKEKYPLVKVGLTTNNSQDTINKLRKGEVDIIIVEEQQICQEFTCRVCGYDELVVVAPHINPWIEKDFINLEELRQQPLIMREEGSGIRTVFQNYLRQYDLALKDFKLIMEMDSISSIKSSVAEGYGISLLPSRAIRKEIYSKTLKALPLEEYPINFNYLMAWSKKQPLNKTLKSFIDFILSEEKGLC